MDNDCLVFFYNFIFDLFWTARDVKLVYMELKDKQREYAKYQAEIFGTMLSKMG